MAVFSCDIETNGLDPDTIWCIVAQDVRTGRTIAFYDEGAEEYPLDWRTLNNFQAWMDENVNTLVFHNSFGFDVPVLEKLLGVDFSNVQLEDTMILSQITSPRRDGGHSLASWGERLGFPKGDHDDWSKFSNEMLAYCMQDVKITTKIWKTLNLSGFSRDAIELEYDIKRYCTQQEKDGWYFDQDGALRLMMELSAEITEVESEVRNTFKPKAVFNELVPAKKHTKAGGISKNYIKQQDKGCYWNKEGKWGYNTYREFNLGSRVQIAEYLQELGWEPEVFTETGRAKVDEGTLEGVDIPEAKLIARYLMLDKRRSMLQSWLDAYNPETHSLHARVHTLGTVTNRMSSSNPNLQQVTASGKEYGSEMRSLFTVPEGKVLVGADLSGLELRCLAHYMNSKEYTEEILNGDIHTANQEAAGLPTRNAAKTFIYAFLYGAGDDLVGKLVGGGKKEGKKIKETFLDNIPPLKKLRRMVEQASTRGYVKALDGRRIHVRSTHSALNFLLQSAGAIIAKRAWAIFHENCTLPYKQLGVIHDEIQIECEPQYAEEIGQEIVKAMEATTDYYNLNCPITGEYHIGRTWNDTH